MVHVNAALRELLQQIALNLRGHCYSLHVAGRVYGVLHQSGVMRVPTAQALRHV